MRGDGPSWISSDYSYYYFNDHPLDPARENPSFATDELEIVRLSCDGGFASKADLQRRYVPPSNCIIGDSKVRRKPVDKDSIS